MPQRYQYLIPWLLQLKFMQENELVFSFSDYEVIDENNNYHRYVKCPKKLTYKKLLRNNYVGCLTYR